MHYFDDEYYNGPQKKQLPQTSWNTFFTLMAIIAVLILSAYFFGPFHSA